jgi:hypothetical protein
MMKLAAAAVEIGDRLRSILTPREVRVLAGYYYDGQTQDEIGRDEGGGQRAASEWIRAALAKLAAAGIVPPPRDRRRNRRGGSVADVAYCDPAALDRLTAAPSGRYRWVDASHVDRKRAAADAAA